MRIIIVDDSSEVRTAYRQGLLALGYLVTEAADGQQALRAIDSDQPQVALIDIHLPRVNGYQLAQAIKARLGSAIRLIMLSGMTLDANTRRLSQQAGFDDCLDKMAGPLALHALERPWRRRRRSAFAPQQGFGSAPLNDRPPTTLSQLSI